MSYNAAYADKPLNSTYVTGDLTEATKAGVTKYGDVFTETSEQFHTDCGSTSPKCVVKCSCNEDKGWFDSAIKANSSNAANVISLTTKRVYAQNKSTLTSASANQSLITSFNAASTLAANADGTVTCYKKKENNCPSGYFYYADTSKQDTNVYSYTKHTSSKLYPNCYKPTCGGTITYPDPRAGGDVTVTHKYVSDTKHAVSTSPVYTTDTITTVKCYEPKWPTHIVYEVTRTTSAAESGHKKVEFTVTGLRYFRGRTSVSQQFSLKGLTCQSGYRPVDYSNQNWSHLHIEETASTQFTNRDINCMIENIPGEARYSENTSNLYLSRTCSTGSRSVGNSVEIYPGYFQGTQQTSFSGNGFEYVEKYNLANHSYTVTITPDCDQNYAFQDTINSSETLVSAGDENGKAEVVVVYVDKTGVNNNIWLTVNNEKYPNTHYPTGRNFLECVNSADTAQGFINFISQDKKSFKFKVTTAVSSTAWNLTVKNPNNAANGCTFNGNNSTSISGTGNSSDITLYITGIDNSVHDGRDGRICDITLTSGTITQTMQVGWYKNN